MKKSFIHQQEEISFVKNTFTQYLKDKLEVVEVQGPILSLSLIHISEPTRPY